MDKGSDIIVKIIIVICLFGSDFMCNQQTISVHMLHHVVKGIQQQGPVHSWSMYVYERFNSWISQRVMNRLHPEATVMETYRVSCNTFSLFDHAVNIVFKQLRQSHVASWFTF